MSCSAIQDTAATAAEPSEADSTAIELVWAMHSVIDSNKANQLALQAAGGLPVIASLLAQASTQPSSQVLPPPPSHCPPDATADHTQSFQPSEHTQPDLASSQRDAAIYSQDADEPQLASALLWLMGSAAEGVPSNQLALQQAGALHLLLHQMQWSKSAAAMGGAMWALASLAKDNPDVQSEVQLQVPFSTYLQVSFYGYIQVSFCRTSSGVFLSGIFW